MIFTIKNVTKHFNGVCALDNLSLEIHESSITAIIGPNGAGKTTLFDILSGFLRADAGSVLFNSTSIDQLPPYQIARLGIGRSFQRIRLFPQMTALENVLLGFPNQSGEKIIVALFRRETVDIQDRSNVTAAVALLERVGLRDKQEALAEELSHGQRRLLEMARALALKPSVLLLDEPFSGLSPQMVKEMIVMIRDLCTEGHTVVFVEHNLPAVMELSERIVVLNNGTVIADGAPEQIQNDQATIAAYLGKSHAESA